MKPHLEEAKRMLRLADRDIAAFGVLSRAEDIHLSVVCFHAQQAIEKCLKAALFCHRIEFRRTHDLDLLASLLADQGVPLPLTLDQLASVNPCAVMWRYDDSELDVVKVDPAELEQFVTETRRWASELLDASVR
jgi:HEPN domain-containing protein